MSTISGLSLNSVQFPSPAVQNDIFEILLRFHKYKYIIAGEISKMSRQIVIDKLLKDKHFWSKKPQLEIASVLESRNLSITCTVTSHYEIFSELINKIFSVSKLLRVTAYILLFLHNGWKSCVKRRAILKPEELDLAEHALAQSAQIQRFPS